MGSSSLVFIFLIWFCVEPNNSVLVGPVDLTWGYGYNSTSLVREAPHGSWYTSNDFCSGGHVGTHLDAPFITIKTGLKAAVIPLRSLISAGAVIDVSEEVGTDQDFLLQPHHLDEWVQTNGPFANQTILLVRFGWSKYYHDDNLYRAGAKDGHLHFPEVSKEAAKWIVSNGNIVGVGVDTLSLTPQYDEDNEASKILHGRGLYQLLQVKMLDPLPARGITLIVMPLKIVEDTGAPCRVIAVPNGFL